MFAIRSMADLCKESSGMNHDWHLWRDLQLVAAVPSGDDGMFGVGQLHQIGIWSRSCQDVFSVSVGYISKTVLWAKKGSLMVKWILEGSGVGSISPRFKSDVNYKFAACSLIMPIATGAVISSVSSCPSHPPFQVSFQLVAFPAFLLWGFKESTSRLLRWSSSFQLSPSSSPSHLAIAQVSGPSRAWSCISSREGFVTSAVRSNKSMICLNQVYFPPKKGMPWMLSPFTETESESPVCFQSHFPLPFLGSMAASPTLMFSNMTCAGPNWG